MIRFVIGWESFILSSALKCLSVSKTRKYQHSVSDNVANDIFYHYTLKCSALWVTRKWTNCVRMRMIWSVCGRSNDVPVPKFHMCDAARVCVRTEAALIFLYPSERKLSVPCPKHNETVNKLWTSTNQEAASAHSVSPQRNMREREIVAGAWRGVVRGRLKWPYCVFV